MKVTTVHDVGEDPDVLAFDAGLKLLYVSAESGNITVFRESGKSLALAGKLFLPHGHTVSVDPDTHLVYFPLEKLDGRPVLRIMEPAAGASHEGLSRQICGLRHCCNYRRGC